MSLDPPNAAKIVLYRTKANGAACSLSNEEKVMLARCSEDHKSCSGLQWPAFAAMYSTVLDAQDYKRVFQRLHRVYGRMVRPTSNEETYQKKQIDGSSYMYRMCCGLKFMEYSGLADIEYSADACLRKSVGAKWLQKHAHIYIYIAALDWNSHTLDATRWILLGGFRLLFPNTS